MYKYTAPLFLLLLILATAPVTGQKRTYSPLSRYGIGELNYTGYGRSVGLGSTGIGLRSPVNLNNLNPASYSAMDSLSFFFEAGLVGFNQSFKTNATTNSFSNLNFDYFAFGFPLAKWGVASFGLQPFSHTGYDVSSIETNADLGTAYTRAVGTGAISKVYGGFSIVPAKNLSLGMHASYLFGNLRHLNFLMFDEPGAYHYAKFKEFHVNDILLDFGVQYTIPINDKNKLVLGATFTPKTAIKGKSRYIIARSTSGYSGDGDLIIYGDTIFSSTTNFTSKTFEMPQTIGAGFSYEVQNKLIFAMDYRQQKWAETNFPYEDAKRANSWRVSSGLEYTPNDRSSGSYLNRVHYRIGGHYLNDYLMFNNHQLKDIGMSFGVGLPLKRTKSSVNVNLEFGKKGTQKENLIQENYTKLSLNFTLHEYWFVKRKFD